MRTALFRGLAFAPLVAATPVEDCPRHVFAVGRQGADSYEAVVDVKQST